MKSFHYSKKIQSNVDEIKIFYNNINTTYFALLNHDCQSSTHLKFKYSIKRNPILLYQLRWRKNVII